MEANPLIDVVDHIMWQPTGGCVASCRECYVKQSPMAQGKSSTQVVDSVFVSRNYSCYQFTVSLDVLLKSDPEVTRAMKTIWAAQGEGLPDLCVTAANWTAVQWWARELGMTIDKFMKPIKICSLSNFPSLGKLCDEVREICKQSGTLLNFNYMVKGDEKDSKPFEMGVRYADQVYLVLQKPALGSDVSPDNLRHWFIARGLVKKQAPNKLIEDQCVTDSVKLINSEECCGAGNKKMHVWPNGQATGCPYDSQGLVKSGQHPMECCKISQAIRALNDTLKNKPKAIENEAA